MKTLGLVWRGMAMGIAEVIPGVSGGTIAFITGIYKQLISSIKAVDAELIQLLFKFELKAVWEKLNGSFLLFLIAGMLGGILIGVFGVSHLLESYPEALWAFFFGLIVASIPFMFSQMENRKLAHILPFIVGAVIAYGITCISPSAGSDNYLYIFIAGVIAISALILPGISGSFMLLLLGLYTTIIPTLRGFLESPELSEFLLLAVFGIGCLVGLVTFSRVVSAAFEKYHDTTIALMAGFMLGSLNKIWPWRNPQTLLNKDDNKYYDISDPTFAQFDLSSESVKLVSETNVFPDSYVGDPMIAWVIAAFFLGSIVVFILSKFSK